MTDPVNKTTGAGSWRSWNDKVARAEEFVRDELRIMGQHKDAEDAEFVRKVALKVALNVGRVTLENCR